MNIELKPAAITTANQIVSLLKSSIVQLCGPDYGHDKLIINNWLENKTEANITQWIENSNNISVSAYANNLVVGFCLSSINGEILLLYVLPEYKARGIGRMLYLYIEQILKKNNVLRIIAYSTITAKEFYLNMGFKQFDAVIKVGQYDGEYPLEKKLVSSKVT